MLVISQNEMDTWFVNGLSIGVRQPRIVVGTKIKKLLTAKNITKEDFIREIGTNYTDAINRILEDREIPKEKVFDKIADYFGVDKEYFYDRELKNVIVNDSHLVFAEYPTEKRAEEIKKMTDEIIVDCYMHNKPIVIRLPKE